MSQMRQPVHLDLDGNGDLLFYFFRSASRPLRDDLYVVVGYVRIGFDGQIVKGNGAPNEQKQRHNQHDEPVVYSKIDDLPNHPLVLARSGCGLPNFTDVHCSTVLCMTKPFFTTSCPALIPEMISCMLSGRFTPALTSTRRNLPLPAGT